MYSIFGGGPLPSYHLQQPSGQRFHLVSQGDIQPDQPQLLVLSFLVLQVCCSGLLELVFHQGLDILDTNQGWAVLWPLFCVTEGSDVNSRHFGAEMVAMRKR